MTAQEQKARVDALVDDFNVARQRLGPTNGECVAVFATLLGDILAEAEDDVSEALYERIDAVLRSGAQDAEALKRLFDTCGVPEPQRKQP